MNFSFWWPVGLVVMAGVGYQVSAKEVAGGADESSAASAELTKLAEQQRRLINQFKV